MLIDFIFKLFLLINIVFSRNPVELNNVCTFPNDYGRTPGFAVVVGRLAFLLSESDYKELLRYPGAFLIATQDTMTTSPNFELSGFPFFTGLYGLTVFPLDLLVELRGYFVPPKSGQYTFTLTDSDDAAIIFFGNPSAFPCGDLQTWPKPSEEDITVTDNLFPSRTLYLIEGVAYPMRIAYYNGFGAGRLNAAFIDPSGTRHTNWEGYIWQYSPCSTCNYSPPPTATTIYSSGWVVSETTTGTSYSIYTGIDGVESTYRIFLVEVPTVTPSLSIPPITTVTISGPNYVEVEVISFVSTTNKEGVPVTGSTTINGTRDYLDADAPHNSLAPAPSPVTHTIDLGNGVTNYEVVSYRTTTNEYGGYITVTETVTFKAPPVTVVELKGDDYVESDWVSFFITTDEKGDIITGSTTINGTRDYLDADAPHNSLAPAPSPVTHTIDLGNGVTNYEVVSYRTTTNEYGGYITVTETVTFKAPPVTVVELKGDDYVESDWVSFFITTDEKGDIITGSTTINGTRDYLDADAPHNSLAPAPSPVTHTIDLGNGVTNYEVVSYRTTTNEYGGYITVTETVTFKAPPVTVVELKGDDYVESDWVSFFITTDEKGDIITGSTTINGTRDYLDADAPHNSLAPAPSPVTHTIDLGNGVTNYEVVSYRTTTNEYGGYITVTETVTFKAPPVTVVELKGDDYVESDWVSFFITTDEKGDIITGSTTINGTRDYLDADAPHNSLAPAPSPVTHTIDLGNGVTNYEVVSYRTTTNEYGGYITVTETVTFKAPPVTVVELKGDDYVESDWVSFFITTDEKGDIITGSTTINGTRDYLDADAPHNSLAPAPSPVTHTIDLGNGVTNYEVVSYRTTTNEYGGYITVTETVTFKAPPVTVVELKGDDYVESDWVSFFITTDEKGDIITGSTTINGTRDYLDADAPHNSLAPAPSPVTHTIDLGNGVTNYEVVSYRTTTNEYGGYITVTETVTFKAPPVTVVELKGDDYVESDWVSFFITTDEKGDIITGSTTINGTRDYLDADAPHNSLAPAPSPVTHTIDLGNGVTNYEVVSYRTTTNEYGGYITVTETVTFKAPPVTVVELKGDDYVESDWVSFFITTDEKGDIITGSTTINGTRDYLDADAPHNSLAPAPSPVTHTIDLGNGVTNYEVVSYRTTTNEYGGYITVTETVTFKAPPVTVVELKGDDYVESDWVSFFITTDEKGDIITGSTTINGTRDYLDADAPHNSLAPAPSPVTHTIDLGNGVTNYEVVSYRTTTNEYGGYITVTETVTFKAPPVTVVELKGDDYVESDWVSFFITTDEKGDIITGSTTINGTRDYLDADAPHNSLAPAPSPVTHTIDLGNGVTNYEVVSYRTTTNEYGGYITVTETVTFKAPPVTVVELKGDDYVESDWVSFFITTDEKGDIITGSTTINGTRDYLDADAPHNSLAPAPSPVTHTIDLGNGVTNYEVVSYRTTTNEYGGYITVTETVTFKAPPVTVVELKGDDYVESDWVSFFITTDEKGDIITGSTTINGTRDYLDADAPHNSLAPAPSPVTHTIDLGNGVTNYEVVSYRTTTNEYGGYITVTETVTFKAPPVTVVELKGDDYVESDWVSFFITTDEKGDIITGSTTINGTRDYLDADAPHNSLAPAPSPVTHTIDLGNGVTNYEVVSYRTTTNEYGGYITVTETVTFKAPPVTVVELKGDDYVESDWVSFFITTDEKGDIITGSTTINGTRDYLDADAPHNSLAPAPSPVTHTIDLGNGVTNYEVVSYRTTTNEYGGYITVTETVTFKAPPVTVVELKGDDYVESDWVSFFITTDEKGDIITGSTTINGTRDYLDADAPHNSLAPAPSPVTHTIDLGNGVTNYEVVSYRTTTNEYGGYITVTETVTFKAPPVTVVELKGDDYVESDWVSFFITTDEKGDIITGSTTINGTRDYLDADAPHNSLAPAPSPVTHTIDLGNGVTNYEVVSYRTTTNEYGGYITVTETVTFKAPPVTVVELKGDDYVESDWVSFFITTDEKGDIITGSTTINGTRDYLDADAPHNSLAPAPSPVTHTIDLGNGVTNYEVVSYRTTTNEYGGYITVTETVTFKAPPVTVVELKGDDYVESDWVSFFITTDEKGDIITGSTTINGTRDYLDADAPHNSLAPAPSPVTHTIDLGNGVTNYEVVSYRTTTNEYGGYITVTETVTFKAPPVTVVELKGDDYVESDWVSFFITTDEKGDIITGSTTINGTRDYLDADAPHNSLAPAPSPVTHTIDLGNGVTNYEVVSYRTTTNEYGGYITVTETVTFKAPPVTVVELKGDDYVESDWVSFFITTDEKGDIITGSTTINGTRDYLDADAPHNSLAPAPSPVTHTIDLGNGVTNYEVVSYRTTTNEYGGYITVTETVTFKAPPVTVVELKGDDYVESDWVSFFITTDEKGDIITGSTTINGTRDYLDADAPHNSLAPAPSPVTHTIDLGNGVTNYEVVSYRTTTNEYGGYITVTETVTFKAPPVTVVELKGDDYVESDWVSFFITTDEKGDIITGSTTINGTRDYLDADAPHNSLAPAPSPVTHTIDLGNGVTNYEVVSYRTTTNEYGGYITVTETVTFKAPPVTVVELKGDDYVESDWVSFFITTDEKGDIITGSTTINGTRDYLDADAPHNSLAPAPSPVTHTIDLGNGVTNYEVVSYRTTTNEYGGYITVTETVTFKAPPVTVVELKGDDYVESDWVSFFITTDEKGDIITGSTTINGTRDYLDADAPHNSLAPAPSPVTHTIDLGNGVTNYEVVSYRTTTNEYGGYITVTETVTFKAPPVTVVELKGDDYVESDWVSFFITTDEKGDIITGSTTINGTRDYLDADAPHNSLAPAPSPVTHTIDLGNGVTNYEVVSYRTTTNEYGGYITVTETVTFKAPPVTVVELKGDDYVESDWVSFFITTDEKGDIITGSTTINGTRDYLDADAPHNSLAPAPSPVTHTIDLGNGVTNYEVVSYRTTTNEYGGYITVTETVTFKAPPVTVVELKGDDYVESDWVSFFITTDEKGDIITGSTTINGTRDYLDADAPHNSLAPAPSPVTHTIDLGNGVTNYEVVSYRTTTNEYGGYITVTETVTFKAPPVTVVELKGDDYVESDWVSFFITTDEKGDIITGSTTINGTRDYLDADAPHNSLAPAPSPVTHTIDLGNGVTNYEVVSYRTTTNEYGGYITVTETVTFKAPPVTVVELKGDDYVESDWVSFFITTDEKGDIITGSTTINGTRDYLDADAPHNSLAPAPSPVTHTIDLGNGVTNYEVVSYRTTTNEYGGYITVTETVTFKAPPVTVVELKGDDYVESDWVSFFITTDEKGDIITGSTTINGTRDYLDADAPHNSLAPAPSPVTHTIDLGNGVTNYEVVSYRTTTNEYGGYITVTETVTFKAPPVTVVELKGDDYVESDWVSFFITTDEKGDIITGSTTINGTRDYLDADAPHNSLAPAPSPVTHTIDLGNGVTNYEVVSYRTTTNEYGGYITVTETVTFKAPPVTVVELKGDDYVESDWVSFFITTDEKGDIITGSTTINGTRDYLDADAPHNSLAPAPSPVTHTIDLGNGVTNYEVVSYRTTTNEYGGYITVTETVTFKAPPVTVVELKGDDYVESDWVSFFITTDEKGDIITGSTTINGTRDYLDADAPHNSLAPAPSPVTHTIDLGNGVTNYEVVSYRTTTNEYGGYITVTETVTFKAPPVTVVELKGDDYVESDWVSFFITTDEKGDIITGSTTINGTRDYLDADAPHNSLAPAPSPVTHTIDLGNGVTNYEVVSYRTTTNEYGGYITVTETVTFKAPPVTVVELKGDDYVESDWVSFFITTDEKGDIITGSTTINGTRDYLDADAPHNSLAPAPSPVTHTIDLGNGVTNYEVVSYRTTTNEYGGYITVTETVTFKAPPVTVVELKGDDYVESDWVSFFITTDEKGDIITGSTTINGTRDYLDADAPHNSLAPAPSPVTHTIDLGNGVTNYEVVSYRTTTNEYGGYITVTETVTFKAPPVTVVELKGDDYVESDWVSFFITTDEKGDIITGSTTINGTRDYLDADAPHNSLAPAPSPVTHTIDLGNGVTNYEVVSYRTTTNEYGGYITVTETVTFKAPPVTVVELKGDDYVESDWVSFFITTDEKGDIITGSTTINGTRDYLDADAPHNSLAPPPSPVTNLIIDVYENVTEYEVVSYYIKANPYGQYLTLTETITFKAPPTTVVEVKGKDYDIRIYVSYFITVANNGVLITESTTLSEVKECLGAEGISKLKSDLYNWAPTQLHFPNSTVSSRSIDSCTNECDKMDQNSSKVKNPNAKLGHKPDALSITQELYGEMPPNSSHMSIETFPTSLTSSRPNTIGESGASSSNLIMSNKLIDSVTVNEIFRLSTISSTNFNSTTTTRDSLANVALELISKLSPHKSDAFPATTPGNERNSNSLQPSRDDSSSIGNSLMHSRDTIQLYNNNQSSKPELYVSKTLTTHSEPATSGLISAEPPRSSIIFSPSTINLYSRFNSTLGTVISKYSTMSVSPSMNVSYSKQFNKTIGSVYYPDSQIINGCASGILNYWQCNFIFPILVLQLFFIL
ncbi:PWP2 [Nakaseomyces glabratus]|nr:PWP2 [Nakaseomyces glabratus]